MDPDEITDAESRGLQSPGSRRREVPLPLFLHLFILDLAAKFRYTLSCLFVPEVNEVAIIVNYNSTS